MRLLEQRMAATPSRVPLPDDVRKRVCELTEHYDATTELFSPPTIFEPVTELRGRGATDLSFESTFRPTLPSYRDEHQRYAENLICHARRWSVGAARPTVILIHGWSQGAYWMTERMLERALWQAAGFDVVAMQLPFHGQRAPADTVHQAGPAPLGPRSGQLFPSPHIARTNEAFGQAIWDLRTLANFLRDSGAPSIGVAGVSLGAYTAALWASLDNTLDFVVALAPPVSLADLMQRHGGKSFAWRRAAKAGIDSELLAEAFAVHAPTTRPPAVAAGRRFVVAGRGDAVTPPDHAEALAKHWNTDVTWFAGGHLAQVGRGAAMREVISSLGVVV